jgi:ABC-2 type transport system ATP-binding protein
MDQVEKLCDSICLINGGKAVLSGAMRELKSRYPRNRVVIDFQGDNAFVNHPDVQEYRSFAGHVEIQLREGADAQDLLRTAFANAKIYKFELMEPSLEEIFIQTVGRRVDA